MESNQTHNKKFNESQQTIDDLLKEYKFILREFKLSLARNAETKSKKNKKNTCHPYNKKNDDSNEGDNQQNEISKNENDKYLEIQEIQTELLKLFEINIQSFKQNVKKTNN
ncbi:hypothetical protein ACTA71_009368 [Dictyostelium dimigraforme]